MSGFAADTGAQGQAPAGAMPSANDGMMQLRAGCPMVVSGTGVEMTDTLTGAALAFATRTGDVGELRRTVQHLAQMYELHGSDGSMMWHDMGGRGGMHGMRGEMGMSPASPGGHMPAMHAAMEPIDNGARLVLTSVDPAQIATLRRQAGWHQQRMNSGECWMSESRPAGSGL